MTLLHPMSHLLPWPLREQESSYSTNSPQSTSLCLPQLEPWLQDIFNFWSNPTKSYPVQVKNPSLGLPNDSTGPWCVLYLWLWHSHTQICGTGTSFLGVHTPRSVVTSSHMCNQGTSFLCEVQILKHMEQAPRWVVPVLRYVVNIFRCDIEAQELGQVLRCAVQVLKQSR